MKQVIKFCYKGQGLPSPKRFLMDQSAQLLWACDLLKVPPGTS